MRRFSRICLTALLALGCTGAAMTGCGQPEQTDFALSAELTETLIADSLVSTGNTNRLHRVFERAQAGEDITIAYVGGSITEGFEVGARSPECFASLSAADFQTNYCSGGTVTCQNNGFSGTSSAIGCLRAESAVLASEPDIILIEYAVNDGSDSLYQIAYESLVRTCLEAPNAPAVILLFTYMEQGHTRQEQQQAIGEYYDLGMISVRDAIAEPLSDGTMRWRAYGTDDMHPSAEGHRLLADMIANYFQAAKAKTPDQAYTLPAESLHTDLFRNGKCCDASNTPYRVGSWETGSHNNTFSEGFTHQKDSGNDPLVMDVTGRKLFLIYKQYSDPTWGIAEVYVNGALAGMVAANSPNRYGTPAIELVHEYDTVQEMHVEIKMLDDHAKKSFEVLALGVCE